MERDDASLKHRNARLLITGLALLFLGLLLLWTMLTGGFFFSLGKQEASETTLETLKVIEHSIGRQAETLVQACSYAGTGNVLQVQRMLYLCNDHLDQEKGEDDAFQALAVLGIAIVSVGEDVGVEMALRTLNHVVPIFSFHSADNSSSFCSYFFL